LARPILALPHCMLTVNARCPTSACLSQMWDSTVLDENSVALLFCSVLVAERRQSEPGTPVPGQIIARGAFRFAEGAVLTYK
jgi:hypothetical protein